MSCINRTISRFSFILSLLLLSGVAFASSDNVVQSLQMPAWYQRGGVSYPLSPGDRLQSGDIIKTGTDSRVLMRLSEGSIVKLGADTTFDIKDMKDANQSGNVFEALLKVVRGAFRFTTTELGKSIPRKVDVGIGHVTVGIRGTDIWGRSKDGEDLFALLEGKVTVQRDQEPAFSMEQPSTYIVAQEGKPTTPVQKADSATVNTLAQQTELQSGDGVISIDGQWSVNLVSLQNEAAGNTLLEQLHQAGYAASSQSAEVNGRQWQRIRIEGFISRKDAESFASKIDNRFGIHKPWVHKI